MNLKELNSLKAGDIIFIIKDLKYYGAEVKKNFYLIHKHPLLDKCESGIVFNNFIAISPMSEIEATLGLNYFEHGEYMIKVDNTNKHTLQILFGDKNDN